MIKIFDDYDELVFSRKFMVMESIKMLEFKLEGQEMLVLLMKLNL